MLLRVDAMFKYRLLSGTLMAAAFIALVIFDGWLDGSLTASTADDKPAAQSQATAHRMTSLQSQYRKAER